MQGLPENGKPGSVILYACALVAMNSLGSWAGPACNNPAFADIVPPHMRNLVFAFDRCFEGAVAACAAPLVGMLAEKRFGFSVSLNTIVVYHCMLSNNRLLQSSSCAHICCLEGAGLLVRRCHQWEQQQ